MKAKQATKKPVISTHEAAFIAAFVIPEKRSRYSDFLADPKRRWEILNRLNHFFDFVPERAIQISRTPASDFAQLLRCRGAGRLGYVIGDCDSDGRELPLNDAIESALSSGWGAVVSCLPGRLALYFQEFPPGNAFILSSQ